jgi:hypothetical protein
MTREVCRADVESPPGEYRLRLVQVGPVWRAEVFAPDGGARLMLAVNGSADACLQSVGIYFDGHGAHAIGVVLVALAKAELLMSEQVAS